MRVLTQTSPYGRRGVAGWTMFMYLAAERHTWIRRGLLALLAIWLMVLSQGAFALSCSVTFSMSQNTTQTYNFTPADNSNCDPAIVGIASDAAHDDYSSNGLATPTTQGGTLKISGFCSPGNQFVYTPPIPSFSGTDSATFYVSIDGANYTPTGSLTITVIPT